MGRNRVTGLTVRAIAAVLLLVACEPPFTQCKPSTIDSLPNTLEPTDVLIEWKEWELPGPFSPHGDISPCDLFPRFTLLADGSAYYIDYINGDRKQPQTMVTHLTPDEAKALVQHVLDLGFECLEGWSSQCGPMWSSRDGTQTQVCTEDGGSTSILNIRLPDGSIKAISSPGERELASMKAHSPGNLAKDFEALEAILALLSGYRHAEAYPYVPEEACLCFDPSLYPDDVLAWPENAPWLTASGSDSRCRLTVSGSGLKTLLTLVGRNRGVFQLLHEGRFYGIQMVPLPRGSICGSTCLPPETP
jgi:hypothetical protein